MKCVKKEGLRTLTKGEMQDLGRNPRRAGEGSEGRVFGGREKKFCREREVKMKFDFALGIYIENASRWIEDLSSTKSQQIWIYWGAVKNLPMAKSPRWIRILLRIYRPDKIFLDGSRICWEAIETNSRKLRWIKNAIRSIEINNPRSSIDRKLSRSYRTW